MGASPEDIFYIYLEEDNIVYRRVGNTDVSLLNLVKKPIIDFQYTCCPSNPESSFYNKDKKNLVLVEK